MFMINIFAIVGIWETISLLQINYPSSRSVPELWTRHKSVGSCCYLDPLTAAMTAISTEHITLISPSIKATPLPFNAFSYVAS